jgi:hypothetical protein
MPSTNLSYLDALMTWMWRNVFDFVFLDFLVLWVAWESFFNFLIPCLFSSWRLLEPGVIIFSLFRC